MGNHIHDWEAGSWGVIIGVSKCKECGKASSVKDFERKEAETNE